MIVSGKEIAEDIQRALKQEIAARRMAPTLFVVIVGDNPITEKFVAVKKRFAENIGVIVEEKRFDEDVTTEDLASAVSQLGEKENAGIIVQLPLPKTIDAKTVLNTIPGTHDADLLGEETMGHFEEGKTEMLPPVVGAIKEILLRNSVFVGDKKVVVVGRGKLVGAPAAVWFTRHGSEVTLLGRDTIDIKPYTLVADIIVLGAGNPGMLTPDMIKPGVVILDAGTSTSTPLSTGEAGDSADRRIVGDADPRCAPKASVFTPVPGGIGPLTVAMLFKNLTELTKEK